MGLFAKKLWVSLDDGAGGWLVRAALDETRARDAFTESRIADDAVFTVIGERSGRLAFQSQGCFFRVTLFFRQDRRETTRAVEGLSRRDCLFLIGGLYALSPARFALLAESFEPSVPQ